VAIVLAGPNPEASGISAFTREDLVRICQERFGKSLHVTSMGRILRELGLSRQKARPSHPQKGPATQAAFHGASAGGGHDKRHRAKRRTSRASPPPVTALAFSGRTTRALVDDRQQSASVDR